MKINFSKLHYPSIFQIDGPDHQTITQLTFHSKNAEPSSVFFAIRGENHDGHLYIEDAIQNGAVAVIADREDLTQSLSHSYPNRTFVLVDDVRKAMASFSKQYYDAADEKLRTVGVTGTNGKTTVAAYVRSLLSLLGLPAGSIGTTGIWSSKKRIPYKKSTPTTPESLDLHRIFNDLVDVEDKAVAMEVSSIALDQHRVDGINFDVAIHTNISPEHLEYHHTFEHYKVCKMKLFDQAKAAVVNVDDEMGSELIQTFNDRIVSYSLNQHAEADLIATDIRYQVNGTSFRLVSHGESYDVFVPVFADYNVANVLSAVGTALLLGYSLSEIIGVLPRLESPEGRFQVITGPNRETIILDYAHTPVALTRLVDEVKKIDHRKLIVMIAGIGIRDFEKMPKMAKAIEGRADEVIVTVDHPGYHEPSVIVDKVMSGFLNPNAPNIYRTHTRREGVLKSLQLGRDHDIILLTSGCINGAQMVKGKEIPHSDEDLIEMHYHLSS
ncbi:UDP-N-acetylmuramoyl-L-alanyl-D-glutamate--2,6-diaminopimelate ligase [Pseudalkalibacillus hwajinpoensis]|uniref:UDP-N-acetylmuramoyl-L-alanyl-D-glutamate--2, 6-diaminopimelate ligase n=1 Tax=Guptibacillus hwajinpoensis TaxID=208199 RepID=UPI001CD68A6E|nr:UDP-N-acetylmuramoyl-L-alanyl-D-glutamate--2,6-diaminopimelate ligase [Pseudalkalibacillus hwajinpoensis]MCA0990718.1 UDP-N-acetylmuramoyl-L-alanyl-D-glutamate--2,6-diaminopimelate ligase [Pseudalkalibacillus hwajinpoensis]